MANIIDSISKLPKWAIIAGGAVVIGLFGFGLYWANFGSKKDKEEVPTSFTLDMPDAADDSYKSTAMKEFENSKRNKSKVSDYWDSLADDDDDLNDPKVATLGMADNLDPNEYNELERYYITNGLKTKEEIDREHAEIKAQNDLVRAAHERNAREVSAASTAPKPLTQAQQDSLYFARLEKAYALAAKYNSSAQEVPEAEPEPQERKLDLDETDEGQGSVLPSDSFSDDGIISSLDVPSDNNVVHYGGTVKVKPVKATFLKNEKLVSGNRVIIRLMQDLVLSDGTVIPANTHITGTCSFNRRLLINITMLHYGGRMFPVDISVYDNDGTEGIYCARIEDAANAAKKAKKVAGDVVAGAGSLVGTLVTGNPFIGRMATSGIQTATSSIRSDGTVSVEVSAGYEFYVYENVKDSRGN